MEEIDIDKLAFGITSNTLDFALKNNSSMFMFLLILETVLSTRGELSNAF